MKRFFVVLAQFLLFLVVFAAGSFVYHPFHIETTLNGGTRSFVWDGLLLMLLVYVLILLIELLRKRVRTAGPWTSLALVLAGLVGWAMKFGFVTHGW